VKGLDRGLGAGEGATGESTRNSKIGDWSPRERMEQWQVPRVRLKRQGTPLGLHARAGARDRRRWPGGRITSPGWIVVGWGVGWRGGLHLDRRRLPAEWSATPIGIERNRRVPLARIGAHKHAAFAAAAEGLSASAERSPRVDGSHVCCAFAAIP